MLIGCKILWLFIFNILPVLKILPYAEFSCVVDVSEA
jgi:hypothetical protein